MNFLGMGSLEILVILLVAFIFLGPERMVDTARLLGKTVRDLRRMAAELPQLTLEEDQGNSPRPTASRRDGASQSEAGPGVKNHTTSSSGSPQAEAGDPDENTPVAFRPAVGAESGQGAESGPDADSKPEHDKS